MSDSPAMTVRGVPDMMPSELPPIRADTPRRVWTIHGLAMLPAMVLLWFMPNRVGASLAAAPWRAAIAAHVLTVALGLGLIVWAEADILQNPFQVSDPAAPVPADWPKLSTWECFRAPLAAITVGLHAQTTITAMPHPAVLLAGVELWTFLSAAMLMPFAAAGERAGPLFGRCLRLSLWSTTLILPLGLGWLVVPVVHHWIGCQWPNSWQPVDCAALAVFAMWWLFVLLRSGYRYTGPPQGPGWEARRPLCESCGYIIAQISSSTKCPECGRPVADSLPERRRLPSFVMASSLRESLRAFRSTLRAAMTDKGFFRRLAVHRQHARDRTFFLTLCFLNGAIVFLGVLAIILAAKLQLRVSDLVLAPTIAACVVVFGEVFFVGLAASAGALIGRRTFQSAAIVAFHALASLQPFALLAMLVALTFAIALGLPSFRQDTWIIASVTVILFSALLVAITVLLMCILRLPSWHPFLDTRRANA